MEIQIRDKITVQPVCLLEGESHSTTLQFSLPRTHAGCRLDSLLWQIQCQNHTTLSLATDPLLPQDAPEADRFLLPWCVGSQFARHSGMLSATLVGSAPQDAPDTHVVAKFSLEGMEVAPAAPDSGTPPPEPGVFETALLKTGQSAAAAKQAEESAQQSAQAAEESQQSAAQSAQDLAQNTKAAAQSAQTAQSQAETARQSARAAAQSAKEAENSAQGMNPNWYDPSGAKQDIFAILGGMPPVYSGSRLTFVAGAGRVQDVCLTAPTTRAGSGEASLQNPRPLCGAKDASLTVNGQRVALPLTSALFSAKNLRTGTLLQDVRRLSGEETHLLALKTFTGTENFSIWGQQNATIEFATDPLDVFSLATGNDLPTALCSHFDAPLTPNQIWSAAIPGFSASYRLFLRTPHKTLTEFKTWLAAQHSAGTPVQVLYQRTAPLTQQNPAAEAPFASGENTLLTNGETAVATVRLKRVFEA